MEYIFIDTNIFFNNWRLTSANFKYLFNYIENTDANLLLSEMVIEEIENIQQRELDTQISLIKKAFKGANKLDNSFKIDLDKFLKTEYSFKKIISDKTDNVKFFGYDNISQKEVVRRALKNIKPFQHQEKGYRDTLIWLSFIDIVVSKLNKKDRIHFITENSSDFFSKDKKSFNSDLKSDLSSLKIENEIIVHKNLYTFIKEVIVKEEHEFSSVKIEELITNSIDEVLEEGAVNTINEYSTKELFSKLYNSGSRNFPLSEMLIEHDFDFYEGVEDPEIMSYEKLNDNSIYVRMTYNIRRATLNFSIPSPIFFDNKKIIEDAYYEIEEEDNITSFTSYVRAYFEVTFELDVKTEMIEGFEIVNLQIE